MRLATWNVNSIRARVDRVTEWIERQSIDVLAIQETKASQDQFPGDRFESLGYEWTHVGTSQWNGVALVSRCGLEDVSSGFLGQPTWGEPAVVEARAVGATCGGIRVWSLYIPNGRELGHPHLAYKLEWLDRLRHTSADWLAADPDALITLMGDWNIAPFDDDVWDMAAFATSTHVSEPERAAFRAIVDAGFTDVVRPFAPGPGVYTYWDYTRLRFARREGMRLDFALSSPALAARVTHAEIDRQARKGKGASDHAPVIVDVDVST